jgi:hypothetical protein
MTNKDTERLVQQAMQQTIPDKEALWAKIESDLPAQPAFGSIRKTPGKMQMVYRVMGAAACFLLVIGSVGVVSSLSGHKNATMSDVAYKQEAAPAPEAPAAADQNCEEAAECNDAAAAPEAEAGCDAVQPSMNIVQEQADHIRGEYGGGASAAADQSADGAGEDGAEFVVETLIIRGAKIDVSNVVSAPVLAEIMEEMPPADAQLKEDIAVGPVQDAGVYLEFQCDGTPVVLTALRGEYRMIVDGRTFFAPEKAEELLRSLED